MSLNDEERSARRRIEFLFGRPVAFHRCFVTVTGGVHAALMLSQALYWLNPERQGESRGKGEGWFWKTRGEWDAELGLSRWEQETARKQLRLTKFWREQERRLEHKIYFGVDFVELEKALATAANPPNSGVTVLLPEGGIPTSGDGGIPSADEGGISTFGMAENPPSSEGEIPPRRGRENPLRKEHRFLQRVPETTTSSSELAIGLHQLMPDTPWDDDAVQTLWDDCRSREPECTAEMVLERVSEKVRMKGWARIQNPIGFLLTSVPKAVQAANCGARVRAKARAGAEAVQAQRENEQQIQRERELAAWEMAERAFEDLPQDRKQSLVSQERRDLLREHPEYGDRVHLPGWERSFRYKAIRALVAQIQAPSPDRTLQASGP